MMHYYYAFVVFEIEFVSTCQVIKVLFFRVTPFLHDMAHVEVLHLTAQNCQPDEFFALFQSVCLQLYIIDT